MSEFDERLKRDLRRAAIPGDPTGAFDRVTRKRARHHILRRVQIAGLAIFVAAGSIGGSLVLARAFRRPELPTAARRLTGNGPIVYVDETAMFGPAGRGPTRGFQADLYSIEPDGSGLHRLTGSRGAESPAWSSDGRWLAYSDVDPTGKRWSLIIAGPDGSTHRILVDDTDVNRSPAWSPDGKEIAFISDKEGPNDAVYLINVDGTGLRRLTAPGYTVYGGSPSWSPDGREIAFVASPDSGSGATHGPPLPLQVYVIDLDGSNVRRLTQLDRGVGSVAWSPDGKHILFDSDGSLFQMNANGSGVGRLAKNAAQPAWSPDGQWIAFIGYGQVDYQGTSTTDVGLVSVMRADGTERHVVARCQDQCFYPAWRPVPQSVPEPAPSSIASPTPTPSASGTLGPTSCAESTRDADFDGDGRVDHVAIAHTGCMEFGVRAIEAGWSIAVHWSGGASGIWPMTECREVCRAFTTPDLNNDGKAELGVVVRADATTQFIEFFELPASEHGPFPLLHARTMGIVAGPPPWVLRLGGSVIGGSEAQLFTLRCGEAEGGRVLIATSAQTLESENRRIWHAHETVLALRPLNLLVVVSSRDYTEPVGPTPSFQSGETLCGSNLGP